MKIFNDLIQYLKKVKCNYPLAYRTGISLLLLGCVMLLLSVVDNRTIGGVNTWYKPVKFSWSIGIYLLTMPFFVDQLHLKDSLKRKLIFWICTFMTLEFILIAIQAARAVPSHYNTRTLFDLWVFNLMGVYIASMALLMMGLTAAYLFRPPKYQFIRWQLRMLQLALLLFLFGCAVGGRMIGNMSHATGDSITGYFVPFVGWHTQSGDLRIPHFLAIHSLQVFPIIALYSRKWIGLAIGTGYGISVVFSFIRAMYGQPVF